MIDFLKSLILSPAAGQTMPVFVRPAGWKAPPSGEPEILKPKFGYDLSEIMTADLHQLEDLAARKRKAFMASLNPGVVYDIRSRQDGIHYFIEAVPVSVRPEWRPSVLAAAALLKAICP